MSQIYKPTLNVDHPDDAFKPHLVKGYLLDDFYRRLARFQLIEYVGQGEFSVRMTKVEWEKTLNLYNCAYYCRLGYVASSFTGIMSCLTMMGRLFNPESLERVFYISLGALLVLGGGAYWSHKSQEKAESLLHDELFKAYSLNKERYHTYRSKAFKQTSEELTFDKACEIIGVAPSSAYKEIDRVWRSRIKKLHPDRGGEKETAAKLIEAMSVIRKRLCPAPT